MDEIKALFKKIKGRDKRSFEVLSDAYGWKLYTHIRSGTEDREKADRIFSQTLSVFYNELQDYDGEDPIEAMLFACADRIGCKNREEEVKSAEIGPWTLGQEANFMLPNVDGVIINQIKEPLWLKIFYGLCIIILIFGILAAVWVMAWMLMSMQLIPEYDFGYSWFNLHIADLF